MHELRFLILFEMKKGKKKNVIKQDILAKIFASYPLNHMFVWFL